MEPERKYTNMELGEILKHGARGKYKNMELGGNI